MIKFKTDALVEFGEGDILVSAGVDYDKKTPILTLTNRQKGKIAEIDTSIIDMDENDMPRVSKIDVKMTFTKPESIDVLIGKLQYAKLMFEIPESERVNEIKKTYETERNLMN